MYYCEDCRFEKDWPQSMTRSQGRCEICNKTALCYDTPSSKLPKQDLESLEPTVYEILAKKLGLVEDPQVPNRWTDGTHKFYLLTPYGFRLIIPGRSIYHPEDVRELLERMGKFASDGKGATPDAIEKFIKHNLK